MVTNKEVYMIEATVKDAVLNGKSGAISLHSVDGWNQCSLSWDSFKSALKELGAPSSLRVDLDKGCVFPSSPEEWAWVENAASQVQNFKFEINGQMAAHSNVNFNGRFSNGEEAKQLRDWDQIRKQQARTEAERQAAGYGKSRMGGWVEM